MTAKFTHWRKSRHSDPDGHCVEVARATDGTIGVRDTKGNPHHILEFTPTEWAAFINRIPSSPS